MVSEGFVKEAESLRNILLNMKKTEIHLHLEGIASPDTIWELMQKNNLQYSGISSKEDIVRRFRVENLDQFIDLYINIIQNSLKTEDDMALLMRDAGTYLQANNIAYAEIFFAPSKFLKMGLDYGLIKDVLSEGSRILQESYHTEVKFLVDVSRTFGLDNAMNNLDLVLANRAAHKDAPIIGIGLGGSEKYGPAKDYAKVFEKARAEGLHVVAHAGEDMGPESVWDTINYLHVERIGHGISSIQDEKLIDYLAEERIPLEVCPTSNLFTQAYATTIENHPVKNMFDKQVYVTINTDDPSIFSTSLIDEYMLLFQHKIFTKEEILLLVERNIDASFLSEEKKKLLKEENRIIAGK
ncbi:MAG: adenosine deaminase [Treponema sp.]|jgi:adenosine deaminase|nr:adenosine deaminase [Treponema sp.]